MNREELSVEHGRPARQRTRTLQKDDWAVQCQSPDPNDSVIIRCEHLP